MIYYFILLLLVCNVISNDKLSEGKKKIIDFRKSPLKFSADEGLYEVDLGLDQDTLKSIRVVAYIDIDNDKDNDIIAVTKNKSFEDIITVIYYDNIINVGTFNKFVQFEDLKFANGIKHVIANDINNDGIIDLIITDLLGVTRFYKGNQKKGENLSFIKLNFETTSNVTMIDLISNLKGFLYSEDKVRKVVSINNDDSM